MFEAFEWDGAQAQGFNAIEDIPFGNEARAVVQSVCSVCHGENGISQTPGIPHLAGQSQAYLAAQLRIFRHREPVKDTRWAVNRRSLEMHQQASGYPDEMVNALASVFARMTCTVPPAERPLPRTRAASRCLVCHDAEITGRRSLTLVPKLAGQRADYLQSQIERLRDGVDGPVDNPRDNPIMTRQAHSLTNDDISELAAYFESLGCVDH